MCQRLVQPSGRARARELEDGWARQTRLDPTRETKPELFQSPGYDQGVTTNVSAGKELFAQPVNNLLNKSVGLGRLLLFFDQYEQ